MMISPEDIAKLALAVVVGGLIGAEREYHDKAAGFRTLMAICLGAALFTIVSMRIGGDQDPTRIAANIVTGIGFLGAGVILRDSGRIVGLTTASVIWGTAALGMAIGGGYYLLSVAAAAFLLAVLWLFPRVEQWISRLQDERTYEVVFSGTPEDFARLDAMFAQCGLRIETRKQTKADGDMVGTWQASGSPAHHGQLVRQMLADAEVKAFRY